MKRKSKELCKVLAVVLAGSIILTACGKSDPDSGLMGSQAQNTEAGSETSGDDSMRKEDITFTYFNPDGGAHKPADDAPVLEQLYEKTGVKFDWDVPTSNAAEKMNIMLATGDLPDLINFSDRLTDKTLINQFVEAGYLVDLAPLLEEYAPNTYANLSEVLPRVMDEDGHLWYLPCKYTFPGSTIVAEARIGFNTTSKYFDENGWEKLPFTLAEYEELLKEIQTETDMIPMGLALAANNGLLNSVIEAGAGANGLVYSDKMVLKDGELHYFTDIPEMKEYFRWLSKLYQEGLIDPESAIMSTDMLSEKVVGGKVWSFIGRGRSINNAVDSYEKSNGSSVRHAEMFLKADDSVDKLTYAKYTENLLTGGVAITTSCKDVQRLLEFYEYMNTEEGHLDAIGIINYDWDGTPEGEEGYDFVVTDEEYIEGRPYIRSTEWSTEMWRTDDNWWWQRGREMFWDFTFSGDGTNYPGGNYDLVGNNDVGVWWDEDITRVRNELGFTGENYVEKNFSMACDISEFSGLSLDADSQEYMEYLDMEQTITDMLPRAILADSDEKFEEEWASLTGELEKNGLKNVVSIFNGKMHQRVDSWEKNKQ